jgi:serine-type D-Ala-D-Ala carboxypeptidase (penicillin-binding protein 5/6)
MRIRVKARKYLFCGRNRGAKKRLIVIYLSAIMLCNLLLGLIIPASAATDTYDPNKPEDLMAEQLACKSAILIQADSGNVIYEKDPDTIMFPASTTKILTVYLAILMGDLKQTVTTSATALMIPTDSSTIPLAEGEQINFEDLLFATMVKSGNDGANLIAETISGDNASFAALMNDAAARFGCTNTHFANPSGLHDETHYTTARDMAIIAREAMQNELFRKIAGTVEYTLPKSNIYRSRSLISGHYDFLTNSENNTRYYQYATGIKTGFHDAAGYCYIGSATKDGVSLISVVFNTTSSGRWSDTKKLMEYGFSQYVSVTPLELYNLNPKTINISGSALDDSDLGRLSLAIRKVDPAANDTIVTTKDRVDLLSQDFNSLVAINYSREFTAPVTMGEVMGTLTYYPDGGEPVIYELIASRSIERRESIAPTYAEVVEYTDADPNPLPRFSLEFLLIALSPAITVVLLILLVKKLISRKRKPKQKTVAPMGRYYR